MLVGIEKSVIPLPPILHVPTPTCDNKNNYYVKTVIFRKRTRPERESGTAKMLLFCFPFKAPFVLDDCNTILLIIYFFNGFLLPSE